MHEPPRVDIYADPGLPFQGTQQILAESGDDQYILSLNQRKIPLKPDGTLELDILADWAREDDADFLIVVTEIPRREGRRVKMVDLQISAAIAVISVPALGWHRVHHRLRNALFDALDALINRRLAPTGQRRLRSGVEHHYGGPDSPCMFIGSPWWRPQTLSLILGMIRANRPLAAVPKLTGVLAAAAATGAFGVFYSSIWQMANALPSWRLGLITLSAIAAMVVWLIFGNRLWERSKQVGSRREAAMYNASTVASLFLAVATLYATLFVGIFLAGLVVIEAGFLASTIGLDSVSVQNYIDIAWLSASLGTVAGALGSNFDSDADIRALTGGRRQIQRYAEGKELREAREEHEN